MAVNLSGKKKPLHTPKPRLDVIRHKNTGNQDIMLDAWESGMKDEASKQDTSKLDKYFDYAGKPLDFLRDELGANFAPKIEELILSVEDNPITVAISSNGYGKTHSAAHIGTYWLCCHPESQVWTTMPQPEENLKRLLWGEIGLIVQRNPELFENYEACSVGGMNIQRHPKCGMYGVTIPGAGSGESREARFSGKHAPYILFIIDEADGVPDEIFRAIEGCLSGGVARLLCMFNPKMESGAVYNFIKNKQANVIQLNALEHPNVVTGKELFKGAVTRDVTVRRINNWTEPVNPGDEIGSDCFTIPDYLVGHRAPATDGKSFYPPLKKEIRRIIDPQFSYAVLAEYPSLAEGQLISKAKIEAARERWKEYQKRHKNNPTPPHSYIQPFMGFDVAETTDLNSVCLRYQSYVAPFILWNGINVPTSARKAADIYHRRNCLWANIDSNGLGSSVPPLMEECGCIAHGIKVQSGATEKDEDFGEFHRMGDQGWWLLRQWLHTDPNAMIPDDELLIEELKNQMYWKIIATGKIKVHGGDFFREKLGRSPDRSFSLMLTCCPQPMKDAPGDLYVDNYMFSDDMDDPDKFYDKNHYAIIDQINGFGDMQEDYANVDAGFWQ